MVLTERVSRKEIIRKIKDKSARSVIEAIEGLRKEYKTKFNKVFKSGYIKKIWITYTYFIFS